GHAGLGRRRRGRAAAGRLTGVRHPPGRRAARRRGRGGAVVSAPEPRRSGAVGLLAAPVAVLGAMLVVPLLVIVANSLVHGAPGVVGGWPPTLAVYADVLGDPRVLAVLGRTLV